MYIYTYNCGFRTATYNFNVCIFKVCLHAKRNKAGLMKIQDKMNIVYKYLDQTICRQTKIIVKYIYIQLQSRCTGELPHFCCKLQVNIQTLITRHIE